jgi:hypothetical protein
MPGAEDAAMKDCMKWHHGMAARHYLVNFAHPCGKIPIL